MALKNTTQKLEEYRERLKQKKAKPIDKKHVEKIIDKLEAKHSALKSELKATSKASKQERYRAKIVVVEKLLARANWLSKQIKKDK